MNNKELEVLCLTPETHEILKTSLSLQAVKQSAHNRQKISQELKHASIIEETELPPDVIRKYSEVILRDLETTKEITVLLVSPSEVNLKNKCISILSPMGVAILGYRTNSVIKWEMPNGIKQYKVTSVKQKDMGHEILTQ